MKRLGLLILLLVGMGAAPPTQPDEEYDNLEQEFDSAQQAWYEELSKHQSDDGSYDATNLAPDPTETFFPRFKAYAEKHAGEPEAIPALVWIVDNARGSVGADSAGDPPGKWAVEQLTRSHAADPALATHLPRLRYANYSVGNQPLIALYERVVETNKDKDAAAWAMFNLGYTYYEESPDPSMKADKPRAIDLFRRTIKDYAGTRAAERAGGYIYEIERLQIGMKAPEIVGTDVNGQEIRLSQFRGQVVVLNFWGHW
jgi:hypothetical protein